MSRRNYLNSRHHPDDDNDPDLEYGRPVTPYHIIEILVNTGIHDRLPGINLRRVDMLRRRSASCAEDAPASASATAATTTSNIITVQVAAATPESSGASPVSSANPNAPNRRPTPKLVRQKTMALVTLDEEELRIPRRHNQKRKYSDDDIFDSPPPPYTALRDPRRDQPQTLEMSQDNVALAGTSSISLRDQREEDQHQDDIRSGCCCWPWFLKNRPVLRLFLVITFNGLVSMMCAAIFIELERPEQIQRQEAKEELRREVDSVRRNLTHLIQSSWADDSEAALEALDNYSQLLVQYTNIEDEIEWEMLAASAFVTSVSSTTGYGDIVPVTKEGKIFTLAYALYGIPVFIWYIVKLGALFRIVSMRLFNSIVEFVKLTCGTRARMRNHFRNVFLAVSQPVHVQPDLSTEFNDEKRFHPSVIGGILVVFLCSVATFISYMEGITYFDAIYACFITYSTIGFGDIDIYRISYRSNWFNLMIYGNCVHVVGYTLISAWISSILDKCGVRKY